MWRLPGAPRHGIGFGSEDASVEEDADERWQTLGGSGGVDGIRYRACGRLDSESRKRRIDEFNRAAEVAEAVDLTEDVQPQKVVRVRYGGVLAAGSANRQGGSLYSWTGSGQPTFDDEGGENADQDETLEPEAVVWPTYREDGFGEDAYDLGPSSPQVAHDGMSNGATGSRVDEPAPSSFEAEVDRIMGTSSTNHRAILCLSAEEWGDVQAIQSKYRRLMRLLHPDKRRDEDVSRAGGKERCDEAVSMVQSALQAAKKAAEDDPRLRLQHSMSTRLQEIQKEQARHAKQRQQTQQNDDLGANTRFTTAQDANPATRLQEIQRTQARQARLRQQQTPQQGTDNISELLESLSRVTRMDSSGSPQFTSTPHATAQSGSSTTTAQIHDLLAKLRQQ